VFDEAGDPRFSSAGQRRPIFANASLGRFCAASNPTRMDAAEAEEVVRHVLLLADRRLF